MGSNITVGETLSIAGAIAGAAGGAVSAMEDKNSNTSGKEDNTGKDAKGKKPPFAWQKHLPWIIGGGVIVLVIIAAIIKKGNQ